MHLGTAVERGFELLAAGGDDRAREEQKAGKRRKSLLKSAQHQSGLLEVNELSNHNLVEIFAIFSPSRW